MYAHPLLPPEADAPLLAEFLRAHGIDAGLLPVEKLEAVVRAFSRLPFENLTKILKVAEAGRVEEARSTPAEVLADHWRYGAGGTCFALTATLLYLVRALGWPAEPILADRRYGADTHSALVVWIDGQMRLLDPGYLIVQPLALPTADEIRVPTEFNELILVPEQAGANVALYTSEQNRRTYRLTYKARPVDAGEFLRAWDISFEADMLRYPILSRVEGGRQLYWQKQHLFVRQGGESQRLEVPAERMADEIARTFRIAPELVARALRVLERKGESRGHDFDA